MGDPLLPSGYVVRQLAMAMSSGADDFERQLSTPDQCGCCKRSRSDRYFLSARELEDYRGYRWSAYPEELKSAAEDGCSRCDLIFDAVLTFGCGGLTTRISVRAGRSEKGLMVMIRTDQAELELFRIQADYDGDEPQSVDAEDNLVPDLINRPFAPEDPACHQALQDVKLWIANCERYHALCDSAVTRCLPKRILELKESSFILKESSLICNTRNAKYACLSHCWGPKEPSTRLLSTTEDALKGGSTIDSLPKTFAEAAHVCLELGIHYLWIDALCIRQDDDDDWREAAATMADIYQNAFLTLAAGSSWSSDAGLRPYTSAGTTDNRYKGRKLTSRNVYVRHRIYDYSHPYVLGQGGGKLSPLFTRGWVFQEQILSPRLVVFGVNKVMWECLSVQCSQDATYQDNSIWLLRRKLHGIDSDSISTHSVWISLLSQYSTLNLTYERDRLPAIAALAQRMMQHRPSNVYVAGMWKSTLLQDLLWSCRGSGPHPLATAPTWSWASVKGLVKHYSRHHEIQPLPRAKAIDLTYTLVGPPHVGQVTDAVLTIKAPVVSIYFRPNWRSDVEKYGSAIVDTAASVAQLSPLSTSMSELVHSILEADFDLTTSDRPFVAGQCLIGLLLSTSDSTRYNAPCGLALREAGGGCYERIGTLSIKPRRSKYSEGEGLNDYKFFKELREVFDDFVGSLRVEETRII